VLEYARAGAPNLRPSSFPLRELVADVGTSVAPAAQCDARFTWDNAVPAGLRISADRDQLFRVLVNLGCNALEAGARRVKVSAEPHGQWVAILMADDGPGLPAKSRERLFRPFAGSAKAGGSGLGLAIARELMHAHGGEISLVESGGGGTVFRLDLPLRRAA
jgi:signal transduction histidine kinase